MKVLRSLVRQVFGLQRALADAVKSDRKSSVHFRSAPASSTARRVYASIAGLEAGRSREGIVETVARVVSVVTQALRQCVDDLLVAYRLRQVSLSHNWYFIDFKKKNSISVTVLT